MSEELTKEQVYNIYMDFVLGSWKPFPLGDRKIIAQVEIQVGVTREAYETMFPPTPDVPSETGYLVGMSMGDSIVLDLDTDPGVILNNLLTVADRVFNENVYPKWEEGLIYDFRYALDSEHKRIKDLKESIDATTKA